MMMAVTETSTGRHSSGHLAGLCPDDGRRLPRARNRAGLDDLNGDRLVEFHRYEIADLDLGQVHGLFAYLDIPECPIRSFEGDVTILQINSHNGGRNHRFPFPHYPGRCRPLGSLCKNPCRQGQHQYSSNCHNQSLFSSIHPFRFKIVVLISHRDV